MATVAAERRSWILSVACRPTILYVAAYAMSLTPHEAAHALTAYFLGFSSTIYQMWVNPDAADATSRQIAIISVSGPVFSLVLGLVAWLAYRTFRYGRWSLFLLMLAINNLYVVFGNMTSAGFGGDIHRALTVIGVGIPILYTVSFVGLVCLVGFMFAMGKELATWSPVGMGRRTAVLVETLAPWLIGTIVALIAYLPLPSPLIWPNVLASAFWLFAVLGAWLGRTPEKRIDGAIIVPDLVITALALMLVRMLVPGLRLTR